jgi:hypothetical protein
MTRDELADRLHHLDPGAALTLAPDVLGRAFESETLMPEVVAAIKAFALEHRCSFVYDAARGQQPTFEKDDIY